MHQIKFTTLLIVFLQIFISLDFANASSKLENNLKLSKLIDLENPWGMDLIDSDNILLLNINDYPFEKSIAYCRNNNYNEYRMSNSIHVGLLNKIFLNKFIELYQDLYINKSKFNLIEGKINYHKNKDGKYQGGGICDMTLFYLLANKNIIDVENLLLPKNNIVFINNVNNGEGYESKEQYSVKNNMMDIKFCKNNQCLIYDKINNKEVQIFNIHYQGGSKKYLNEKLKNNLNN